MKFARVLFAVLLAGLSVDALATRLYTGPQCYPEGGFDTTASLNSIAPASSFPCGIAWTADNGEMVSDGTNWTRITPIPVESTIDFQSGPLTSVLGTKGTYIKMTNAATVDNMTASALALVCVTNPTIALLECGTSTSCSSPTTIASVQVTGTGTATPATVSSPSITAGDYVGWQVTGGVCTSLNLSATAQLH